MDGTPRSHLIAAAALAAFALLVGLRLSAGPERPSPPAVPVRVESSAGASEGRAARIVIHVAGEVRRPGVYELRPGLRVDDAVQRAGGPTRRAELSALNLAGELEDGRQVLVPRRGPGRPGSAPGVAGAAADAPAAAPIDLNTATLEQLDTLEGIGPTTAQKILDWRMQNGGFGSVEELAQIPGIGEKRMATLRERVTV